MDNQKKDFLVLTLKQIVLTNEETGKTWSFSNKYTYILVDRILPKVENKNEDINNVIIEECQKFLCESLSPSLKLSEANLTKAKQKAKSIIDECKKKDINYISLANDLFPRELKELVRGGYDVPVLLFYKGDISKINERRNIAIIGTREPHDITIEEGRALAKELSDRNINIISGLAKGCDTAAHEGALLGASKYTVAILAGGLNSIYPPENEPLAARILENGGCLISEDPPKARIQKWSFPQRDRIQSGIVEFVIVLQTRSKGGSMITARFAHQQHKKMFCYLPTAALPKDMFSGNEDVINKYGAEPLRFDLDNDVKAILDPSQNDKQNEEYYEQIKLEI